MPASYGYSVLILTQNEEATLPGCLASLTNCDDVVVLDSGSTDRTTEIARAAGARVFEHPFSTFAQQRNFAHRELPFRHPWVLHVDADERLPPEFLIECGGALFDRNATGFLVARKLVWHGRWVRHSSRFRQWQPRLVRSQAFEFAEGPTAAEAPPGLRLDELVSCPTSDPSLRGATTLLERHQRYAEITARYLQQHRSHRRSFSPLRGFFARYVLGRGFLDGRPGYEFCRQLARYDAQLAAAMRRVQAGTST